MQPREILHGETALFRAARYGKTETFNFLADQILESDEAEQKDVIQRKDKTTILHMADGHPCSAIG